uniref:Bm88 n=1 Tax=Brugia malayi TaxID=6279 RepID=A0A1I9GBU9_BRUMA|nr:Bm88 [Brugia malayi]
MQKLKVFKRLVLMSFQQSGLKENIQLSKETTELIESLAVFLRVPLTPSQLLVCVELLQKVFHIDVSLTL